METILIVEDEIAIRDMLVTTLELAGFQCLEASDIQQAYQQTVDNSPALILLDWMLQNGASGIDFCRRLKKDDSLSEIPIIMLTAKGEEDNKIQGLDAGADDYITKPFSIRELISRIKAVLRRSPGVPNDKLININGLCLDKISQRVKINDTAIEIGPTEYRLLAFFMTHSERAYTRSQLLDHVWGGNVYVEDRTIDVHIRRLRKILEPYGFADYVQTMRGIGYRFSQQPA
ncbi:phosphate regulon transcriptional regulator PhoB [Moraxella boevrei]|uniref:phosphate regulon transcriptional regulator PhoB n=1 Tax=Faucicola boevrei TaxID=346665 RepID=UPI00373553CA